MVAERRRRALFVLGLVAGTSALAYVGRPTVKLADKSAAIDLEALLPRKFADWRIDDSLPVVLPPPDVQQGLSKVYNQVLTRTYINAQGERIMLSIAYGGDQSDGTRAHRPESCYPAQGFAITSNKTETLPVAKGAKELRVRRLVAQSGSRREPITYWIIVGDEIALSGTEQKLAQLQYGVRGYIPDGMLVRVSSIAREPAVAYAVHDRFLRDLHAAMAPGDLARVFGAAK